MSSFVSLCDLLPATKQNPAAYRYGLQCFCAMTGLSRSEVLHIFRGQVSRHYTRTLRPKPTGGVREIFSPSTELRVIQQQIVRKLLKPMHDERVSAIAHGYVQGRSVASCLKPHLGAKALFLVDIENAFPTVDALSVVKIFQGASSDRFFLWGRLPHILADFCTYCGPSIHRRGNHWTIPPLVDSVRYVGHRLPQGSLTAPYLFNLACRELDQRLINLSEAHGVIITRYADNLVVSSQRTIPWAVRGRVLKGVIESGFRIARKKVHYQELTVAHPLVAFHLVISDHEFRITNSRLRRMRIHLYNALKSGNDARVHGILQYVSRLTGEVPRSLAQVLERHKNITTAAID